MSITLFAYDPTLTVAGLGGTFTRADASTCATYVDSNGVVQTVAANVLRNSHYVNGVRTTLLEGSRTNNFVQSGDLSNAAWTATSLTSRNKDATGPDGVASSANTLVANGGVSSGVTQISGTATTAAGKATVSVFVKKGNNTWCYFGDGGDATNHRAWFNLDTASFGTVETGGSTTSKVALGNGWYRLTYTYTTTNAYNQRCVVGAAEVDGGVTPANGQTLIVYGPMGEIAAFPSSYIATGAAAVTRAADALSFPFSPVPQASTFFFSGYDLMAGANLYAMGLAKSDGSAPQINIQGNGSAKYLVTTNNGSANVSSTPNQTVAFGDGIEFRGVLNADGSVLGGISDNSAAEVLGSTSGANTLAAQWGGVSNPVLGVAQLGNAGSSVGFVAVRKIVIASGVQSLATMRTLTATSGVVSATLAPSSVVAEGAWYAQPAYTVLDTGTATALQASAIPTNTNQQVRVLRLDVTCSAAPAAGTIVNIQDGGTVLWQGVLSAGSRKLTVDFTRKPLRGSRGATVTAEMASAGGSVVQTIVMTCDTVRAP